MHINRATQVKKYSVSNVTILDLTLEKWWHEINNVIKGMLSYNGSMTVKFQSNMHNIDYLPLNNDLYIQSKQQNASIGNDVFFMVYYPVPRTSFSRELPSSDWSLSLLTVTLMWCCQHYSTCLIILTTDTCIHVIIEALSRSIVTKGILFSVLLSIIFPVSPQKVTNECLPTGVDEFFLSNQ